MGTAMKAAGLACSAGGVIADLWPKRKTKRYKQAKAAEKAIRQEKARKKAKTAKKARKGKA